MPWQTMKRQEVTPEVLAHRQQQAERMKRTLLEQGFPTDRVTTIIDATLGDEIWLNDKYQASVRRRTGPGPFDATEECVNGFPEEAGEVTWLSIKRHDKGAQRDWRDLQSIKNDIVGPEAEAIEIYPAESRLMDTANQTPLFALHKEFPVGFTQRVIRGADQTLRLGGKQREPESGVKAAGIADGHRRGSGPLITRKRSVRKGKGKNR